MLWIITGIVISYLAGAIPTAYLFGRFLKGIDIRSYGSGNVGATNALRVLGKGPGLLVLVLDIVKGFLPVFILTEFLRPKVTIDTDILLISLGISCIVGHIWTVFLDFKGGKGIAPALGVLLAFSLKIESFWMILVSLLLLWVLIFFLSRIVSLASIIASVVLPVLALVFKLSVPLIISSFFLSILVIYRHKSNLGRLLRGSEPKTSLTNRSK